MDEPATERDEDRPDEPAAVRGEDRAATRVTLADVAASAGVSPSTASLAFSGRGHIAPATRAKVLEAAERLGYLGPNPTASSLRRGRSGIVGIVIGDELLRSFRDPMTLATLDGIVEALAPLDLGVLLLPSSREDGASGPHPAERTALDAAILVSCVTDVGPAVTALRRRKVPMIGIEGPAAPDIHPIAIDDEHGTTKLVEHLRERGHEKIAVVTLPFNVERHFGDVPDWRWNTVTFLPTARRLAGLWAADLHPVRIIETPGSLVEYGRQAGEMILDPSMPERNRPTAIIAQSDLLAAGVVLAARDAGLAVPNDLAVVGFDGIDLPWFEPDVLTTMTQHLTGKGKAAGDAVGAILAGEEPPPVLIPVHLRVGTTT